MKCRNTHFTLIELLVVIAIIAILAAILLPTLQRAKQSGIQTNCMGNFKQIGGAMQMYISDMDGYLPGPAVSSPTRSISQDGNNFVHALEKLYLKSFRSKKGDFKGDITPDNSKLWYCPGNGKDFFEKETIRSSGKRIGWLNNKNYNNNDARVSWKFPFGYADKSKTPEERSPKKLETSFGKPVKYDGKMVTIPFSQIPIYAEYTMHGGSSPYAPWHNGTTTLFYADGHSGGVKSDINWCPRGD